MISREDSIPHYTDQELGALSTLNTQFNDFDVYVEDTDHQNFYFAILRKLIPQVKIENIYPLNGKQHVLSHAKQGISADRSIYILDKDFDDLLGRIYTQDNIFYLNRYCIENFVVEKHALVSLIISEKPKLKAQEVLRRLDFDHIYKHAITEIAEVFTPFLLAAKHNIAIKNTSYKPDEYYRDHAPYTHLPKPAFNRKAVENYTILLSRRSKSQQCEFNFIEEIKLCRNIVLGHKKTQSPDANISGEFLLYILITKIKAEFDLNLMLDITSLAYRLAKECSFESLQWLKHAIERHLKGSD